MCAPQKVEKAPTPVISTPPPPEKTVDALSLSKDEDEKTLGIKKKRGTQSLKLGDVSALKIPDKANTGGLIIP